MTNKLEKQFFDTFGIEPISYVKDFPTREKAASFGRKITGIPKHNKGKFEIGSYTNNIDIFQVHWKEYPQITDTHYLKLICILNGHTGIDVRAKEIGKLKEELLEHCIDLITYELCCIDEIDEVKHQVRTLFEEG